MNENLSCWSESESARKEGKTRRYIAKLRMNGNAAARGPASDSLPCDMMRFLYGEGWQIKSLSLLPVEPPLTGLHLDDNDDDYDDVHGDEGTTDEPSHLRRRYSHWLSPPVFQRVLHIVFFVCSFFSVFFYLRMYLSSFSSAERGTRPMFPRRNPDFVCLVLKTWGTPTSPSAWAAPAGAAGGQNTTSTS